MKKLIYLLFVLLISTAVFAQENTLLGDGEIDHGGFGGPVVKFTSVNDEFALLVGGRGGWIINHTFTLGGGGYGLVNEIDMGNNSSGNSTRLMMGYGGFEMGLILSSNQLLHMRANILIGAGAINIAENRNEDWFDFDYDNNNNDTFFILEPSFGMELNVTTFFRMDVGVSYRFVSGVNYFGLQNEDIAGPSADITLKFGKF